MSYFRELPNLLYQSNLLDKVSSRDYVLIKNIFRRVKLQDYLTDKIAFFDKYTILDMQRPDNVAEIFYGQQDLDWVVILTAGITNIKDEWPLSNYDLYRYVENKYGLTEVNNVHHYETIEVRDNRGRLILPGGQIVDQDFKIKTPYDASETKFYITNPDIGGGGGAPPDPDANPPFAGYGSTKYTGVNQEINPVTGISNYEYEPLKNEKKRKIELMKPSHLQLFLNDMRDIMRYDDNSRKIDSRLSITDNTRLLGP